MVSLKERILIPNSLSNFSDQCATIYGLHSSPYGFPNAIEKYVTNFLLLLMQIDCTSSSLFKEFLMSELIFFRWNVSEIEKGKPK